MLCLNYQQNVHIQRLSTKWNWRKVYETDKTFHFTNELKPKMGNYIVLFVFSTIIVM